MKIQLYTKPNCPLCEQTKEQLKRNHLSFRENVIGVDIPREQVLLLYPEAKVAPVIVIDGNFCTKETFDFILKQKEKGILHD